MNKRKLSIVGGLILLVASIFLAMKIAKPTEQSMRKPVVSDLKLVRTSLVKNQDVNSSVAVTGKLEAKHKIEIYAEVSGVMLEGSKEFKPGNYYRKGEVLVRLDDAEARLEMLAQKSNVLNQITLILPEIKIDYKQSASEWLEYVESFDVNKPLPELPEPKNDQEKYFFA